jgi:hypothetical protein
MAAGRSDVPVPGWACAQSRENEYFAGLNLLDFCACLPPIKAILVSVNELLRLPGTSRQGSKDCRRRRRWQANMPMCQSNAMRGEKTENVTKCRSSLLALVVVMLIF